MEIGVQKNVKNVKANFLETLEQDKLTKYMSIKHLENAKNVVEHFMTQSLILVKIYQTMN